MSDLLPILDAIDRRIDLDEALAMRRSARPRLSSDRREVWRRTRAARFMADPIIAAIGMPCRHEDAKRLSPEGVAARASEGGIAQ